MNYWLDLFSPKSWQEFRAAGCKVTGFNARMKTAVSKVQPGDILMCYLTGVMHWVGALQVTGVSSNEERIWADADFPLRFDVRPIVILDPEYGIPMSELEGKVIFFQGPKDRGKFMGFIRMSPNKFANPSDGEFVLSLLKRAEASPVVREIDPKRLAYRPLFQVERRKGKVSVPTKVSVPESDQIEDTVERKTPVSETAQSTRHTEIQFCLLSLGMEMGLDLWVARNDRSRKWNGRTLGDFPSLVRELPTQFNEATTRTIELIDVLWLKGNSIVAAFEVECTTAIYSGLLRMSDLLSLQPNLDINLFLVAADERREKVEQEILRPTFALREKPLAGVCGFLSFSKLTEQVDGIRKLGLASSLKPDFLQKIAEYFADDDRKA
ncbi:MAG: hypothetical protein K1X78_06790 [Verrucomicrobiaceae bacterium]|nr:hypothetical protein [Verrucomicrobiaceae bacterium]